MDILLSIMFIICLSCRNSGKTETRRAQCVLLRFLYLMIKPNKRIELCCKDTVKLN